MVYGYFVCDAGVLIIDRHQGITDDETSFALGKIKRPRILPGVNTNFQHYTFEMAVLFTFTIEKPG
jgi:hypothetical protein